jgi:hypothetical protein
MALLTNPHWEVVPPLLQELLIEIGQEPFSHRFYLAGGTALAIAWETIKEFFVQELRRIGRMWFEPGGCQQIRRTD